ncbi:hypothetical protein GGR42_000881 [Saonia flava]|uniref:Uncharacterized protein n=1 Tax=Saonia flava TaxID=523696 RepID=A0A846R0L9_9FLAO|nr:hypothetical protein [Saonia flava]
MQKMIGRMNIAVYPIGVAVLMVKELKQPLFAEEKITFMSNL